MEYDLALTLVAATIEDYHFIQNMSRFYIYDLSRDCGFTPKKWGLPSNGLYESIDLKSYFEEHDRKAFLIKVGNEIAGFIMLNKAVAFEKTEWNMGEFFIVAKFQGRGIGKQAAYQVWAEHLGIWEVHVIPENIRGLSFWRKTILNFTDNNYLEELKEIDYDPDLPKRVIFSFDSAKSNNEENEMEVSIRSANIEDVPAIVKLSYEKRRSYEKAQPQFWAHAKEAEKVQKRWFEELLLHENYLILIAESKNKIIGFGIGNLTKSPEVYDPGGLTLLIDDFCVETPSKWESVGTKLVNNLTSIAKTKGASQILIVCGAHDHPKSQFLKKLDLNVASEWYVGKIP